MDDAGMRFERTWDKGRGGHVERGRHGACRVRIAHRTQSQQREESVCGLTRTMGVVKGNEGKTVVDIHLHPSLRSDHGARRTGPDNDASIGYYYATAS